MTNTQKKEHGPADAWYSNLPAEEQTPRLGCLCGWHTSPLNSSWQEAGEEFDGHLREAST